MKIKSIIMSILLASCSMLTACYVNIIDERGDNGGSGGDGGGGYEPIFQTVVYKNTYDRKAVEYTSQYGQKFILYGPKDMYGNVERFSTIEQANNYDSKDILQLDEYGYPLKFTARNNIIFYFEWVNYEYANIKIYDPDMTNQIFVITKWKIISNPFDKNKNSSSVTTDKAALENSNDEYAQNITIKKAGNAIDADMRLELFDSNSNEWITTIHDYAHNAKGSYTFKMPKWNADQTISDEATINSVYDATNRLNNAFYSINRPEQTINDAVLSVMKKTGYEYIPSNIEEALRIFEPFIQNVLAFTENYDIEDYYHRFCPRTEEVPATSEVTVIPYIWGQAYTNKAWTYVYGSGANNKILEMGFNQQISPIEFTPSNPKAGEDYNIKVSYSCLLAGSKIVISLTRTNGYKDYIEKKIETGAGTNEFSFNVPGAEAGEADWIELTLVSRDLMPEISQQAFILY